MRRATSTRITASALFSLAIAASAAAQAPPATYPSYAVEKTLEGTAASFQSDCTTNLGSFASCALVNGVTTITFQNFAANLFLAGPATPGDPDALPSARAITPADLGTVGNNKQLTLNDTGDMNWSGRVTTQHLKPEQAQFQATNFPAYVVNQGTNFPISALSYATAPAANASAFWKFKAIGYASGNLTVQVYWYADTATTGDIIWGSAIAAITPNTDTQDVETKAFATASTTTTTHPGTTAQRLQRTAITVSNLDSIAIDDIVWIKVYRDTDAAGDTMAGAAFLVYVTVDYAGGS